MTAATPAELQQTITGLGGLGAAGTHSGFAGKDFRQALSAGMNVRRLSGDGSICWRVAEPVDLADRVGKHRGNASCLISALLHGLAPYGQNNSDLPKDGFGRLHCRVSDVNDADWISFRLLALRHVVLDNRASVDAPAHDACFPIFEAIG